MKINQQIALVLVLLLSSCTGQNVPIISTLGENTVINAPSATVRPETLPLLVNTSQATEIIQTNTPSSLTDASLDMPTVENDPTFSIPVTGQEGAPSDNNETSDKFQEFEIPVTGFLIPLTGFPPRVTTRLEKDVSSFYNSIPPTVVIPALHLNLPIYGIPLLTDGMWDVTWLWDQAGWLEGTAYPTMEGNSILTAHVVTADGKDGPFVHLKNLTVKDYIFIVNSDFRYIYKVDSIRFVKPDDRSVFSHEEDAWLTLITCDSYDEKTGNYLLRVVVRAQLVEIQEMK